MPELSSPARPPVPASLASIKPPPSAAATPKHPASNLLPPWFPPFLRKKRYLYIAIGAILLWIGLAVVSAVVRNIQKSNRPKPQFYSVAPTATPTLPDTGSPNDLPNAVTITQSRPDWQRYTNSQGGWWLEYPSLFTLQTSSDFYASWQPTWFEDTYYFDCINRQVGSRFPFPCWIFQIYLGSAGLADPQILNELPADLGPLTNFSDSQNRTWQTRGPVAVGETWRWYASLTDNDVTYVFDTRTVKRNLSNFVQTHPQRPFASDITSVDDASLQQIYQNLLHQVLGTFGVVRKPLIPDPKWLRHRFSNNWSVAYPESFELFNNSESDLPANTEGLLAGWYGNGEAVSRHRYAITLTTPGFTNAPASLSAWVDSEIAALTPDQRRAVETISQGRRKGRRDRKTIEFDSTIVTSLPNPPTVIPLLSEPLPNTAIHRAYVWEFDELPPRLVTIKQLDPGFEPARMQQLLLNFVNRIYE